MKIKSLLSNPYYWLLYLIFLHIGLLLSTQFIDWPEMLLYPWLVKHGLQLFTDLYNPYQPLPEIILLGFYQILGFSVNSLRLIHLIFVVLVDLLLFNIIKKLTQSIKIALISLLLYLLWQPAVEGNGLWFDSFLLLPAIVSFYFFYKSLTSPKLKHEIQAGLFLGITILCKQTALWLLLLFPLMLIINKLIFNTKSAYYSLLKIFIFTAIPILLQFILFFLNGNLQPFLFWVYQFGFNLRNDANYQLPPNYAGDWPLILLFIIILFLSFYAFIKNKRSNKLLLILTFVWTLISTLLLFPRWTLTHAQLSLVFLIILFAVVLNVLNIISKKSKFVFAALSLIIILTLKNNLSYLKKSIGLDNRFYNRQTRETINSIKNIKGNSSYYLFGNTEYMYAYLKEPPQIKPFVQLFPWNTDIPGIQEKLISEVDNQSIQYIFYSPYQPSKIFYNYSKPVIMVNYLETKYKLSSKLGDILIYTRKN